MRDPRDGEAAITTYGVGLDEDALTLPEKAWLITRRGERTRVTVTGLVAADAIVSESLVQKYADSREWEGRPLDVVRLRDGALVVIDGHHRLAAAALSGATSVPARVVDGADFGMP